jgi:DNA-binding NarL/FixJ family response regulator
MTAVPATPDAPGPTGLLVVDDHELVRLGLQTLVHAQAAANEKSVKVFEARTLQGALDVYRNEQSAIGLVLLDLHLPDAHGLSGLTAFLHQFPKAPVVVLSGASEPAMMREALAHGARAYLTKSGDLQPVVHYIRSLGLLSKDGAPANNAADHGPHPLGNSQGQGQGQADADNSASRQVTTLAGQQVRLTSRQGEILDWILTGYTNREIADKAHLSEGTVKNHVSTLLLMFGVRSRAQLISQLR